MNNHVLLALLHSYPIRMKQLQKILSIHPDLNYFPNIKNEYLQQVFRVAPERINMIKKSFLYHSNQPLKQRYEQYGIQCIAFYDARYPKKLLNIYDPPIMLFAKGRLAILQSEQSIACIGSRQASVYSYKALQTILPPLIQRGIPIVSGLAQGADTMAHTLTDEYGGRTIAVLGHGLHMIYPKRNESLARKLEQEHLLISEYPLFVGPQKHHFPMRNRIISGLSDALVVTEAALRSGTMITTEHALEAGKDVFVVPGPITSPLSVGTNKLIKDGAIPVMNGFEIVEQLTAQIMKN